MIYLHLSHRLKTDEIYTLQKSDPNTHYIRNVRRLEKGAKIYLCCNTEDQYLALIEEVTPQTIVLRIDQKERCPHNPIHPIEIGLSMIAWDRFEWALQKGTELGMCSLTPCITERVQHTLLKSWDKKKNRLQEIIRQAAQQSGRSLLPVLHDPMHLKDYLKQNASWVLCDIIQSHSHQDFPQKPNILIGPEGGFTEEEYALIKQHHPYALHLAQGTLRSETAAIAAISASHTILNAA